MLAPTGERYGPADVPTLNQWVAEGRLFATSRLMEEMSGDVIVASTLPGLSFGAAPPQPMQSPMQPPPPGTYGAYPNPPAPGSGYMPQVGSTANKNDLLLSFAMVLVSPILSLFCVFGFTAALYGIASGWRAYQNGQSIAILAVVLNVGCLVFWVLARFVFRHMIFEHMYN